MHKLKLFNPEGNDSKEVRELVGGDTTNLFNLNNSKFTWANEAYKVMMQNFWIPEVVSLTDDDLTKLTKDERRAFEGIISFLTFLDSIQTNNIPHISDYISAPEVKLALAVQTYQEAVHSQSYAYIIESLIPSGDRDRIYDIWREDKVLFERNKYIASIYQDFLDTSNEYNFEKVLVANYLLESIYFYNGFSLFYTLASRNKMVGTSNIIRYINRDELTHVDLFANILNELEVSRDLIWGMMSQAVAQEIAWTNHIIGDNVLGINSKTTVEYTQYLANVALGKLGMGPMFNKVKTNPYRHLEAIADTGGEGSVKANYFESKVTAYNKPSAIKGWDTF